MITITSSSRYKLDRKKIKHTTEEFLYYHGYRHDHVVNVVFVGKNKMKKIAHTYKQENTALPVLSFLYNNDQLDTEKLLGEIMICYPQAVLLAAEREKRVEDIIIELILHGLGNIIK